MSTMKFKNPETGEWEKVGVQPGPDHASTHAIGGSDELTPEMIGARPDTWTPTAEEIGAAPGGFGWGIIGGKDITGVDPNTVLENGFYVFGEGHANYPTSVGYSSMLVLSRNENYSTQILFQSNTYNCIGYVYKRVKFAGAWYAWERIH